jgi:hypothetical protein
LRFGHPYRGTFGVGIDLWRAHDLGQWLPMYPPFPAAWQMAIRPWHHVSTSPPCHPGQSVFPSPVGDHGISSSITRSSSLLRAHAPDPFPPVVSLRIRIGQLIRLDSHQLDYSLVGCSDAPVLMCCIRKEIVPRINHMPRRARINAPGALHHVICRGIERRKIFFEDMISVMPYRGSHK